MVKEPAPPIRIEPRWPLVLATLGVFGVVQVPLGLNIILVNLSRIGVFTMTP